MAILIMVHLVIEYVELWSSHKVMTGQLRLTYVMRIACLRFNRTCPKMPKPIAFALLVWCLATRDEPSDDRDPK